jgi:RimJ/RimL family protein N-acetyltransferase
MELVDEELHALVDAELEGRLGLPRPLLRGGGVHVVEADLGANDAMSFLLESTCIVVVPPDEIDQARLALEGLAVETAFTAATLQLLVGSQAQIDGPSWHGYANRRCFRGSADIAAHAATGEDASLLAFLETSDIAEWTESGFPRDPTSANPATTRFWVLRDGEGIVAAGNMTEWRGLPADVGVLTQPMRRGQGLARRLVGAMVAESLPSVGVVRYRALASNVPSLAVALRLGFEAYGQNFRARRRR